MRESKIEKHFVAAVKAAGGEVRKVKWIGRRGAPDRMMLLPDRMPSLVELKATDGKVEPHQEREHNRLRGLGFTVLVLNSIEAVDAAVAGVAA